MKYIRHIAALALLTILSACRTAQPPAAPETFSVIPKTLSEDSWLPGSDSGYHLPPQHDPGDSYGQTFDGGETTQRRIVVTFSSGNRGDLVAKCRVGIRELLQRVGADERGAGNLSDRDGMRDFAENYKWHGNVGIIRVYSAVTGENAVTLILFCNERKPRA